MKIHLILQFRGLARDLVPLLPPEFAFLGDNLEDYEPANERYRSDSMTSTAVLIDAPLGDRIIAWGRQRRGGRSLLRGARINEVYEIADLDGHDTVEVFAPYGREPRDIKNAKEALDVVWTCAYCNRVAATQVADLSVSVDKGLDLQLTDNSEWVVSRRAQEVMQDFGIQFRPLKNTKDFAQALVTQTCIVRPDIRPYQVLDDLCPGCGRRSVGRTDWVEGDATDSDYPDILIDKEASLTVSRCEPQPVTLARSDQRTRIAMVYDHPVYEVGAKIESWQVFALYYLASPALFAGAEVVRRLLEVGATGITFRPVRVMQG